MSKHGVLCDTAGAGQVLITLEAASPEAALAEVRSHIALFYGPGDGAGRWLASRNPDTLTQAHEAKPIAEWEAAQ